MLDWREQAGCRKITQAERERILFPEKHTTQTRRDYRVLCNACPVKQKCLNYSIETGYGLDPLAPAHVWGGTEFRDRVKIAMDR